MKILSGSQNYDRTASPVVAIGNFDGMHRAHQHLIFTAVGLAQHTGQPSAVYTFSPHPAALFSPSSHLPMIQTPDQKAEAIKSAGIDLMIIEPFTHDFAKLSPDDFFKTIFLQHIAPSHIVVGYDFTFGQHRAGTVEHLRELCHQSNIGLTVVPPQFDGETLISSSHIRQMIAAGHIHDANILLGRPYAIEGTVKRRRGIGRQLGVPTANIVSDNDIIPAYGVYATAVHLEAHTYGSVTNIGFSPTTGGAPLAIETHIFDFDRDITDHHLSLSFLSHIRGERRFDSLDELVAHIHDDIQQARAIYATTFGGK